MKILGNVFVFVITYLLFMLPTYLLPYFGSNSAALNTLGVAADAGMNPLFWLHLGSLGVLVLITWFRGVLIDKKWLVIFPILAAFFDLMPGLNWIPLVPTVMHLCAIIIGAIGARATVPAAERAV